MRRKCKSDQKKDHPVNFSQNLEAILHKRYTVPSTT